MMEHVSTGREKKESYNGDYMECGAGGESEAFKLLKSRIKVLGLEDLRNATEWRRKDADVRIIAIGGKYLAEIKTDTWLGRTGYVLNEIFRIYHYSHPSKAFYLGWTFRSEAEWLIYYAPNREPTPAFYIGRFNEIRGVFQQYTNEHLHLKWLPVATDENKTTYNILIPEKEYENVFEIIEL